MKIRKEQIVSLSHTLYNDGNEHFPYEAETMGRMNKDWYIECVCKMGSHCGTHVEVEYHHDQFGRDVSKYPVEDLIGEGIVIDVTGKAPGDPITVEDVKPYADRIQKGDIIFLHTGYDAVYRDEKNWQPYPYVELETLNWLLQYEIKVLGTDASGVEITDGYDAKGRMHELYGEPIHVTCFKNHCAIVESLTNLGAIEGERVTFFILPVPAEGMDAFPCQIIAVRDI